MKNSFQAAYSLSTDSKTYSIELIMRRFVIASLALLLISVGLCFETEAQVPAPKQSAPIVLMNGTIHTVSGDVIQNGAVVIEKGKITAVGDGLTLPVGAETIDLGGKHVFPALFEASSQLGLAEIGAVAASVDTTEIGSMNPNVKANVAINPDSEVIPVTRSNGVLLALCTPTGGTISGKASVIQLDGWTYEDMTLKADCWLQVNWPGRRGRRFFRQSEDSGENGEEEQLRLLYDFFAEAKAYHAGRNTEASTQEFDARLDAMGPVLSGDVPLMVAADGVKQIEAAVAFAVEHKIKLAIIGGYDAPHCAELLKKHDVPVIVSAVYRRPRRRDDGYDAAYALPAKLKELGIKYCISGSGKNSTWNVRALPFHAATSVGFGLDEAEALKAITLYPAEILGVADRVGSIEVGKDATLFVATGSPLETATQVTHAFIQGRNLDLQDRHKRLYQKYKQKYEQLNSEK